MRGREPEGYAGVDLFRLISAFLVVAIHTSPLADITPVGDFVVTSVIARLAVPFFFMTSGFFTVTRYAKDASALAAFEKRTLLVYLAATAIYLPVNIRNGYFTQADLLTRLLRDVLFDGTFYHLWYLPAAALGAAIAWALVRRADYPAAFAVTGAVYLVGLFGDSWFGAAEPVAAGFYDAVFCLMDRTRVFMAPLFFTMGAFIRDSRRRLPWYASAAGTGAALALMTGEALELRALGWARFYTIYLTLPICAFFIFELLLGTSRGRMRWARSMALLVYIIHPLAIIALRGVARPLGLWEELIDDSVVNFLAVCALSAVVALPAALVLERLRPKKDRAPTGRAWRELDSSALEHNASTMVALMPEGCELMAVIKANAYGHGEFEAARVLEARGVRSWAVATAEEGVALRRYGIHGRILVLGYTHPGLAGELRRCRLTQTVVSVDHARALNDTGVKLDVHLKIDTGMHRLGVGWADSEEIVEVFSLKNLNVTGVYTHLAMTESRDREAQEFTRQQRDRLFAALRALEEAGIELPPYHIQSTYGLLNYPELSVGYIRVGLGIYGVLSAPGEQTALRPDLWPALSLRARVALVRQVPEGEGVGYGGPFRRPGPGRIAILPIGYADGFPRELSGGVGYVLIRGKRAPVVGAVCMDQLAVDVTDIPEAAPGDIATVIGRDGEEELTAPELASMAGTITNELLSRLGPRLPVVVK